MFQRNNHQFTHKDVKKLAIIMCINREKFSLFALAITFPLSIVNSMFIDVKFEKTDGDDHESCSRPSL